MAESNDRISLESSASAVLAAVRAKLGVPEGRAVSVFVGEVRAELAAIEDALRGLDSDLGDGALLSAHVAELREAHIEMTKCHAAEVGRADRLQALVRSIRDALLEGGQNAQSRWTKAVRLLEQADQLRDDTCRSPIRLQPAVPPEIAQPNGEVSRG